MKFWTIDFGAHVRFIQRANLRRWNFELIKSFKLCFVLRFGFASVFSSISSCVYLVTCDNQYTWIVIECWILFERVGYPSPPPLRILAIIDNLLFNSWAHVNEVRKKKGRETVVVIKWPLGPWQRKTVLCVKSCWTEARPICLYTARKN